MLEEILSKVIEKLKTEKIQIASPFSEEYILSSFEKIDKSVSKDIIKLYTTIGGYVDENMDNNLFSLWTLKQLITENSKYRSNFTLFGDYSIFCCLYAFKYENENISSVYSDFETGKFLKIADSVEHFLSLYLTNPIEIGLYQE